MPEAPSALDRLRAEMARQHTDARATFAESAPMAGRIAAAIRAGGGARLVGMGASHGVNLTAATALRRAGIDAVALTASEALDAPPPAGPPRIYLSQSGESGEIRALLARAPDAPAFGITLTPDGLLARSVPTLVGAGGPEEAFAATRSVLVSLAAWARIAVELGVRDDGLEAALTGAPPLAVASLARPLADKRAIAFVGHGALGGTAAVVALTTLELARVPTLAFDPGGFRHGPVELLGPELGLVLLRCAEPGAEGVDRLARRARDAGYPPVIVDATGAPDAGADLHLDPFAGIAAALAVTPVVQALAIEVARLLVDDVGTPRHARKVIRDI